MVSLAEHDYLTKWVRSALGLFGLTCETSCIAENFRGRKLSREFRGFVAIRESFLREIWGCVVLWRGTSEQSAKVFSLKSFPLYVPASISQTQKIYIYFLTQFNIRDLEIELKCVTSLLYGSNILHTHLNSLYNILCNVFTYLSTQTSRRKLCRVLVSVSPADQNAGFCFKQLKKRKCLIHDV